MSVHLLDVGSTSIKYAAYDPDTRTRGGERALPFPPPARQDSPYYEVEAEAIVRGVEELLEPAREGDEIRVCVQMHGYLLCDREGRALSRYISWRDRRSLLVPEGERYPFELPPTRGVARKSNLPLAGLCMMRREMPDLMRRAAQFCTLGSYLTLRLAGQNASHITDLAATGLYDARTGALCAGEEWAQLAFPRALMEQEAVGIYRGARWHAPVGDQQASVAGSGLRKGQALLNVGTAAQMCAISEEAVYGAYESRPYFGGRTLCTVTGLTGGRDYAYWAQRSGARRLAEEYGAALERLPGCEGIRAVGGACRHYRTMLEEALCRIGVPWEICEDRDALDGLIRAREEETR